MGAAETNWPMPFTSPWNGLCDGGDIQIIRPDAGRFKRTLQAFGLVLDG
jgi:hypothetical protein